VFLFFWLGMLFKSMLNVDLHSTFFFDNMYIYVFHLVFWFSKIYVCYFSILFCSFIHSCGHIYTSLQKNSKCSVVRFLGVIDVAMCYKSNCCLLGFVFFYKWIFFQQESSIDCNKSNVIYFYFFIAVALFWVSETSAQNVTKMNVNWLEHCC
jgi:hypothetical protein